MKEASKPWLDKYPVLKDEDHNALESDAAINEFKLGMPKDQAEDQAHKDYLKQHAIRAAAHHLHGMRVATAANDEEAGKAHSTAYEAALKHAGLASGKIPKEVEEAIKKEPSKLYSYKGHPADTFFLPKDEKGKVSTKGDEPHIDNSKVKAVIEGLGKLRELLG